jgi:hypothetical protein
MTVSAAANRNGSPAAKGDEELNRWMVATAGRSHSGDILEYVADEDDARQSHFSPS